MWCVAARCTAPSPCVRTRKRLSGHSRSPVRGLAAACTSDVRECPLTCARVCVRAVSVAGPADGLRACMSAAAAAAAAASTATAAAAPSSSSSSSVPRPRRVVGRRCRARVTHDGYDDDPPVTYDDPPSPSPSPPVCVSLRSLPRSLAHLLARCRVYVQVEKAREREGEERNTRERERERM